MVRLGRRGYLLAVLKRDVMVGSRWLGKSECRLDTGSKIDLKNYQLCYATTTVDSSKRLRHRSLAQQRGQALPTGRSFLDTVDDTDNTESMRSC